MVRRGAIWLLCMCLWDGHGHCGCYNFNTSTLFDTEGWYWICDITTMNANHMVKIVWTLVKRVVWSQFPRKKVKTGYRSCEPSTCLVATKQITCPGSPWTQSFHATVDPRHAVYRTPLAPLPLEYCQEAWLDEIMGDCTRPWFKWY